MFDNFFSLPPTIILIQKIGKKVRGRRQYSRMVFSSFFVDVDAICLKKKGWLYFFVPPDPSLPLFSGEFYPAPFFLSSSNFSRQLINITLPHVFGGVVPHARATVFPGNESAGAKNGFRILFVSAAMVMWCLPIPPIA